MKIFLKYLMLVIIPAALIINISYNDRTEFGQDPNFIYLFNALNLASGSGRVGLYPHPGTTVVEISSVIISITHHIRNNGTDLSDDVLSNPNLYIKVVVRTLAVINSILLFFLGLFIMKTTNDLFYSLLFQVIPMFSYYTIEWSFQSFCPEPVLFGSVIIFVLLFMWRFIFMRSFGEIAIKWSGKFEFRIEVISILLGIIMGFCLVTKVSTLPLILLPFFLFHDIRNKTAFIFFTGISFMVFTLPIWYLYKIMISWLLGVVSHTGLYGGGQKGFIDTGMFIGNLKETFKFEPIILFIVFISALFVLWKLIRKKYHKNLKILLTLVIVQLIFLFMVLKHFHLHYYIPLVPTLAINIYLILQIAGLSKWIKAPLIISLMAVSICLNKNIGKSTEKLYDDNYPADGINIFSYKCKSSIYALKLGDDFSMNASTGKLKEIYGNQYFYNIATKYITAWDDTLTLDSLFRINKTVYLHALELYIKELPPPFKIKLISEGLYKIEDEESEAILNK